MKKLFILLALLFTGVACFGAEPTNKLIGEEITSFINDTGVRTSFVLSGIDIQKDFAIITITVLLGNTSSYQVTYKVTNNDEDVIPLFFFNKRIISLEIQSISDYDISYYYF